MLPVSGLTAAVSDRDDEDVVWLNGVKNRVRKNSSKSTPDIFIEGMAAIGILQNPLNRLLNPHDEPQVQPGLEAGIVVTGLVVFFESLGMKLIPHRPKERRTRASASSPGIV
jgi:hypothetical protein